MLKQSAMCGDAEKENLKLIGANLNNSAQIQSGSLRRSASWQDLAINRLFMGGNVLTQSLVGGARDLGCTQGEAGSLAGLHLKHKENC